MIFLIKKIYFEFRGLGWEIRPGLGCRWILRNDDIYFLEKKIILVMKNKMHMIL